METLTLPALCLLLPTLGAQTFQVATQPLALSIGLGRLDIGDFNGDGRPDLAYLGLLSGFLIAGGPGGTFAAPVPLPGILNCSSVQLADSNADGRLDIWYCDNNGCIRLEQGATGIVATANLGQARSMTCADFDEDGHVDILVGADAGLALARGDGLGGFLPAVTFASFPTLGYRQCVASDLNGDHHWDLVVGMYPEVKVFLGNGAGSFTTLSVPLIGIGRFRLADVDGDGRPDLVTASTYSLPTMLVLRNIGLGQFGPPQLLTGLTALDFVTADFDGDGIVDLVGTSSVDMWIALGLGGGQFAAPTSFPMPYPYSLVTGDVDGDGRVEALAISNITNLQVLRLVDPTPTGLRAFGSGSPACAGTIGIRGTVEPTLGAADFRVQCTNVPKDSVGLLAIGTAVPGGWQPLGLGLQFHLGIAVPLGSMHSDAGGTASRGLPLPGSAIFSGLTVHLQSFWLADASRGNTCSTALFELASSRGLSVTLH